MRVAFDVGGVLSKYPEQFRQLIKTLRSPTWCVGSEVFVISDMHPKQKIVDILRLNDFSDIPEENVYSADYDTYGEACKAILLEELKIDMFFDDFIGYVAVGGAPIRLLVMPDAETPYYADSWKMPEGEPTFGRRTYTKKQAKGRDT
jgi:hypothetical protein